MDSTPPAAWRACVALLLALGIAACGSGSSGGSGGGPHPPGAGAPVVCETGDARPDADECGLLYIGITDIEGDFIRYRVDIAALRLQRFDGTWAQLLPAANSVDFVLYRDKTELATAATLPVGSYVRAEITLDFTDADIRVDVDGRAVRARVVSSDGVGVRRVALDLELDKRRPLVVEPGLPALLEIDFNLAAANSVDTGRAPPRVTLLPVVTAENNPPLPKPFRLRGPLISVDESEVAFRIALRPFFAESGRQGGVDIEIRGETDWEIDGERLFGASGLGALAALPPGTSTLAFGAFDRRRRRFIADQVFAGSSVPGDTLDAVDGNVLARDGNLLALLGARLIRAGGGVTFLDRVDLQLGDSTPVTRPGFPLQQETIGSISIGQRITALGHWDGDLLRPAPDAGRVRLQPTRLDSFLNARADDELQVTALTFDGRDALLFDYSGTGRSADRDADPDNYRVDIGALEIGPLATGTPLRFFGFAADFRRAPPDFEAISLQDFGESGAQLLLDWIGAGGASPFLALDAAGLSLNLPPDLLGPDHFIRRGDLLVDLLSLSVVPRLVPVDAGGLYALVEGRVVTHYSDFGDFATDLDRRLGAGVRVRRLYAEGGYRSDAGSMAVNAVIVLFEDF